MARWRTPPRHVGRRGTERVAEVSRRPGSDAFARSLLELAVGTPSPSGQEAAVVERLRGAMVDQVDEATVDAVGNLVVRQGRGPLAVTFLGHVDTVPGVVPVEVRGGALYGRGSVDAKGPLSAALAATARMPAQVQGALTVRVIGAVGEESPGSVGARHAVETQPRPDLLVVCEPSGWDATTLGYKGQLRLQLSCARPGGHSAGPDPSAADRLVWGLGRLVEAMPDTGDGEQRARAFDRIQATVLALSHEHDGLTEHASATVGLRLPPAWPPDRVLALVGATELGEGLEVTVIEGVAAVRGARDSTLARAFRIAIRDHGGRPRNVVKTGTSDWNVVAGAWDVPTLAYGPGDARLDHAPDEHLELADFDAAVDVVTTALGRLAQGTERPSGESPPATQSPDSA